MSTFDGRVKEFPDIRIDYFRPSPADPPPLAYFLSHVHSDHLVGLESCKSPFIYCSPATRDILLRLEKYPHRMNFARGILESRRQTYGHLRKLLKAIPLETPTGIELCPGRNVRVTLVDANHCVGGVGFLIEGDGKAVFYTGDVRAEGWWVEALVRSPAMIPFTVRGGRRLDCLYLDTTFATKEDGGRYREFPSKAEGLRELVEKAEKYPKDTIFYYGRWSRRLLLVLAPADPTMCFRRLDIRLRGRLADPLHRTGRQSPRRRLPLRPLPRAGQRRRAPSARSDEAHRLPMRQSLPRRLSHRSLEQTAQLRTRHRVCGMGQG